MKTILKLAFLFAAVFASADLSAQAVTAPEKTIEYAYGVAFDETVKDITELIALANRRIKDPNA